MRGPVEVLCGAENSQFYSTACKCLVLLKVLCGVYMWCFTAQRVNAWSGIWRCCGELRVGMVSKAARRKTPETKSSPSSPPSACLLLLKSLSQKKSLQMQLSLGG